MENIKFKNILGFAIISLFVMIISIATYLKPIFCIQKCENLEMTITATGNKCEQSFGTEIRFKSIIYNGQEKADLSRLADQCSGWEVDGDLLSAYEVQQPAVINLSLKDVYKIELNMIGQRGSGKIKIETQNISEEIDLYRDADWEEVSWTYTAENEFAPQKRPDLLLEIWILILIAIVALNVMYTKYKHLKKSK